jgi:IS30 family transposase
MAVLRRKLTVFDRTMIEMRRHEGWGVRRIATALGRSPGTISDEIKRHSDAELGYLAEPAQFAGRGEPAANGP